MLDTARFFGIYRIGNVVVINLERRKKKKKKNVVNGHGKTSYLASWHGMGWKVKMGFFKTIIMKVREKRWIGRAIKEHFAVSSSKVARHSSKHVTVNWDVRCKKASGTGGRGRARRTVPKHIQRRRQQQQQSRQGRAYQ